MSAGVPRASTPSLTTGWIRAVELAKEATKILPRFEEVAP
jgi:hypothetical protein